jgi:coenzyme F420-reducing hydrogenase beta subunit
MISLNDKKDCMGCYACLNICPVNSISMINDMEGFWYPQVDYAKCIKCGQCRKVCPILIKPSHSNVPRAYACINKEEVVRLESSSGGIFTLIAEQVIENGGVAFGAGFNDDFTLKHSFIEVKEELFKFRGSKYVQSRIGNTYSQVKDFLKLGRSVLFTGTPCQIGGLKSYLGQSYDNLICVDIICHGVPSPKVWKKYVQFREERANSQPIKITFRQKNEGWKRYSISFLFKNNTEYNEVLDKDLYMQAFLKDVCLRPSCYACEFKSLHRQSDITLADFWGIQNILPDMDDDKGTSLVFVNSDKGQLMLDKLIDKIICKEVNINQSVKYNSAAIKSANCNIEREAFFNDINKLSFDDLVNKYCSEKINVRIKNKIKSIGSSVLRRAGALNIMKKVLKR